MRIINCTNAPITDSQFEEVKVSKYYRDRISAIFQKLPATLMVEHRNDLMRRLVALIKELDRNNCGKVCLSAFIDPGIQHALARAFLEEGYDTYRCNTRGKDVTWIDPR